MGSRRFGRCRTLCFRFSSRYSWVVRHPAAEKVRCGVACGTNASRCAGFAVEDLARMLLGWSAFRLASVYHLPLVLYAIVRRTE